MKALSSALLLVLARVAKVATHAPFEEIVACTKLTDQSTYFSIDVAVGTPPQHFDAVADTGSTSVLVPSCFCESSGLCHSAKNRCFSGRGGASSTFNITRGESGPLVYVVSFGSGPVRVVVTGDVVRIADMQHTMKDGLLVMLNDNLEVGDMAFEGIFGLGLPLSYQKSFMDESGVASFSMCFADGQGYLHVFKKPPNTTFLGTVSNQNWAVNLNGVTVGSSPEATPLSFCQESDRKGGAESACAAIPDSGTTLLLGPEDSIYKIQEGICDEWPRCTTMLATTPLKYRRNAELRGHNLKAMVISSLLRVCGSWFTDEGLEEMPPIKFYVSGKEGNQAVITVPATNYVLTDGTQCLLGFSSMDVSTGSNGDLWILGMPIFFSYHVTFDLQTDPHSVSFTQMTASNPCSECNGNAEASLLSFTDTPPKNTPPKNRRLLPRNVTGASFRTGQFFREKNFKF